MQTEDVQLFKADIELLYNNLWGNKLEVQQPITGEAINIEHILYAVTEDEISKSFSWIKKDPGQRGYGKQH
jgi:hypothetical protein